MENSYGDFVVPPSGLLNYPPFSWTFNELSFSTKMLLLHNSRRLTTTVWGLSELKSG